MRMLIILACGDCCTTVTLSQPFCTLHCERTCHNLCEPPCSCCCCCCCTLAADHSAADLSSGFVGLSEAHRPGLCRQVESAHDPHKHTHTHSQLHTPSMRWNFGCPFCDRDKWRAWLHPLCHLISQVAHIWRRSQGGGDTWDCAHARVWQGLAAFSVDDFAWQAFITQQPYAPPTNTAAWCWPQPTCTRGTSAAQPPWCLGQTVPV